MVIDLIVRFLPLISAVLYTTVGIGYFIRKDYAWSLVWLSYALSNIGLVMAAAPKS